MARWFWSVMHLGLVLGNLVGAAAGDSGTAAATREALDGFRADPLLAPLAPALTEILAGHRDPALAARLRDPAQRAMVTALLHSVADLEDTEGPGGPGSPDSPSGPG
ncbi:hypothetical protein [Streptomyces lancefieldiae]|uniref:Uncharacterized protein n=1 Tax=Streptomyces lancefieldiae TaxID=3075520 RepID=A0ABU3AVT6_9ACTN|nr:hypothetical protein [Streptomyces sp. DSM 40712]MDT0614259.1 hypothetical protein [Streptomyces sp. DSM 40712]